MTKKRVCKYVGFTRKMRLNSQANDLFCKLVLFGVSDGRARQLVRNELKRAKKGKRYLS